AEEERHRDHPLADEPQRIARDPVVGPLLLLVAERAQQQGAAHHRAEEDELLAERVEASVVEDRRADDVRGVTLVTGNTIQEVADPSLEVAERREAREGPEQERAEDAATRQEERRPRPPAHLSSFEPCRSTLMATSRT